MPGRFGPLCRSNICSYTAAMATYALAGTPPLTDARPATGITARVLVPVPARARCRRAVPAGSSGVGRAVPRRRAPEGGTVLLGPMTAPDTFLSSAHGRSGPTSAAASRAPGLTSLLLLLLAGHRPGVTGAQWPAYQSSSCSSGRTGVNLDRLVLVPRPGSEGRRQSVVATLLETVDLVCLARTPPCDLPTQETCRPSAESIARPWSYSTQRALLPELREGFLSGGPRDRDVSWHVGPAPRTCVVP